MKQMMLPFLTENEDIGMAKAVLNTSQKCTCLRIEVADWGEPFVKACYYLEGDGPLAVDYYEAMDKIIIGIRTEYTPNVRAVAQLVSGKSPTDR